MALFGRGKKPDKKDAKAALEEKRKALADKKQGGAKSPSVKKPGVKAPGVKAPGVASPASKSAGLKKPAAKAPSVKKPSVRKLPVQPKKPGSGKTVTPSASVSMPSTTGEERKVRKSSSKKQIGQLLLAANKLTEEQLEKGLKIQERKGGLLGQILVRMEAVSKADVGAALKKQRTITTVDLSTVEFDPDALILLPRDFCEKFRVLPFEKTGNQLCVAMSNALDTVAKTQIKDTTQMHVKIFDAGYEEILTAIKKHLSGAAPAPAAKPEGKDEPAAEGEGQDLVIELPDEEIIMIDEEAVEELAPAAPEQPAQKEPEAAKKPAPAPTAPEEEEEGGIELFEGLSSVDSTGYATPATGFDIQIEEEPAPTEREPMQAHVEEPDILLPEDESVGSVAQALEAVPVPEAYLRAVLVDGKVDAEARWLVEHTGTIPLPVSAVCA